MDVTAITALIIAITGLLGALAGLYTAIQSHNKSSLAISKAEDAKDTVAQFVNGGTDTDTGKESPHE
jgi:hypothetical protein